MYKIIKNLFSKPLKEEKLNDTLIIDSVKNKIINMIEQDEEVYDNIDILKNEISINIEEIIDNKINCKLNELKENILEEINAIVAKNINRQTDNEFKDVKKHESGNINLYTKIDNNINSSYKEDNISKDNDLDNSNNSTTLDKLLDIKTPKTFNGIVQVLKPLNRAYFSIKRNEIGEAIVDFSIKNSDKDFYKEYFNIDLDGISNEYKIPKAILEKLSQAITKYNDKIYSITIYSNHKTLYSLDKYSESSNIVDVRNLIEKLKAENIKIIVIKDSGKKEEL